LLTITTAQRYIYQESYKKMKRSVFLAAAIFAISACGVFEEERVYEDLPVGSTVENFRLVDTSGAERSVDELKGKNGAILVFVSAQCPVVKQYNERISEFAADFEAKGINVIGINSNSTESLAKVRSHTAEKYKFPVLIDKGNVLADKLGADVTPEIFYINEKNVLVYHGAIDNSTSGDEITRKYLREAVEANLSGKPVTKPTANAIGCSIKRA
jgi:peroxiredoxin